MTTIIEVETGDGSTYLFNRDALKKILSTSYAEETRSSKAASKDAELELVWAAYHAAVNMTHAELAGWSDGPCSHMAGVSRTPVERNLHLLSTPKEEWGDAEVESARRTINFVSRMRGVDAGEPASAECQMSKRTIALRNWGHDTSKATKSAGVISQISNREISAAVKSDEERTVFGLVLEPNDGEDGAPLNPDTQGEIYSRQVIRDAAHSWMLNHRMFDVQHEVYLGEHQAKVVESYLAPVDFDLPLPDGSERRVYQGTWLMVVKILDDKLWKAIKAGSITGFSMNGFVAREKVKVRKTKADAATGPAEVLCFYHRDQDGAMSAAVVLHHLAGKPVDLVSVQYGEPFPFELLAGRKTVYVLDFMPQPFGETECLAEMCDALGVKLVLIDHHAQHIRELRGSPLAGKISGLQESAELTEPTEPSWLQAGCDLAWRFLCNDEPKPVIVRLVGRWDVWDHADPLVRPVAFALESVGFNPAKYLEYFDRSNKWIAAALGGPGTAIYEWVRAQNQARLKAAFPVTLAGHRCLAVNSGARGSMLFEGMGELGITGYDAGVVFRRVPGHWTVSVYPLRDGLDAGEICAQFGGGGHRGSGGFEVQELPFDLP